MARLSPLKKEQKWILNAIAELNGLLGGGPPPNPLRYHDIYRGLLPTAKLIVEKNPNLGDPQKIVDLIKIIESRAEVVLFQGGLIEEYWVDEL